MMNEKKSFIIEDLDSHHLVIKADEEYRVREELSQEVTSQPLSPPSILANPDSSWRKTRTAWNHDTLLSVFLNAILIQEFSNMLVGCSIKVAALRRIARHRRKWPMTCNS